MADNNQAGKLFKSMLVAIVGLPPKVRVFRGTFDSEMEDGEAWIKPDKEGLPLVHITNKGRQDVIHGTDFMGDPRVRRRFADKAHLGVVRGRAVFYTQGRGDDNHSSYWMVGKELLMFMDRLEKHQTIAVFKAGNDSDTEPDWVGFASDFIRRTSNDPEFEEGARFERFNFEVGEWEDGEDPRLDEELVDKVMRPKEDKTPVRRTRSGESKVKPSGPSMTESAEQQLGGVLDGTAEVDSEGNAEPATPKSGGQSKTPKAKRRGKAPKLEDAGKSS